MPRAHMDRAYGTGGTHVRLTLQADVPKARTHARMFLSLNIHAAFYANIICMRALSPEYGFALPFNKRVTLLQCTVLHRRTCTGNIQIQRYVYPSILVAKMDVILVRASIALDVDVFLNKQGVTVSYYQTFQCQLTLN